MWTPPPPFRPSQNEALCKTIHMEMCSAYRFILMQIKIIFIWKNWKVLHKDSFLKQMHQVYGNSEIL